MPESAGKAGELFVVATPIGNMSDMTFRAVDTLSRVDLIAAEDTRRCRRLLARYSISTPMVAYHEHNEQRQTVTIADRLLRGESVALVSDAGTPLISDPGYKLIRACYERGIRVVPIPGCCAAIAALSVPCVGAGPFVMALARLRPPPPPPRPWTECPRLPPVGHD